MKITINNTKFLDKEADINHKGIVTLVSEGGWEESLTYKKEDGTPANQFTIKLQLDNGEIRSTVLNWTNVKLLVQAFGDESSNWINKEVRAWRTKSEKAKLGYTYVFAPIDWERDDTGEWVIPESYTMSAEEPNNLDQIPF